MTKKARKEAVFVTQDQWQEGMDMTKDFFAKLFFELKDFRKEQGQTNKKIETNIAEIQTDITEMKTDIVVMKEDITEMKTDIVEMKQNIEMNTQAINLVSKQQQETQKIENDIFNHEQRITKLEKVR